MQLNHKPSAMKRSLRSAKGVAPFRPCSPSQRLILRAQKQDDRVAETSRRDFLSLLGLLTGLSAAQAAQAADPYEEMRALSAARTGSTSLLESFEGTKGALAGPKVSRGIREKLAAEAAPQKPSSGIKLFGSSSSSSSSSGGLKPSAAAPKPKPFSFSAPAPKAPTAATPAPKPAAAAAAAGGSSGGGAAVPAGVLQAAGVLGLVGVGASVATSAATSKPKAKAASAQPSRAATPAVGGTGKVQTAAAAAAPSRPATGKVSAGAAASAAKSTTGKVSVSRPATPVVKSGTGKVSVSRPATPSLKSATSKVQRGTAAAAASGSTVRTVVKQALVNEEAPEQPTDFATAGFLGFVGLLGAFFLFGLPEPQVSTPTASAPVDPLVEQARQAAASAARPSYTSPLFKSAGEGADDTARKVIGSAAPKAAAPPALFAAPAVKLEAPKPVEAPKVEAPRVVEAPKPAAPVLKVETSKVEAPVLKVEAPKAEAPKIMSAPKAEAPKAAAPAAATKAAAEGDAAAAQGPSAAQNLLVAAGGIAVVVTALAMTGSSSSEGGSSDGAAAAAGSSTPAAVGAAGEGAGAVTAAAAEGVSAVASAAAAVEAAPKEGAQPGNAAYDQAVLALMSDPEVTEDIFSVMSAEDATQRNIPALAWSLTSTPSNTEKLDGFAFQKLPKQRYERVREVLLGAGLRLPDSPKVQAGAAASLAPVGNVDSSEVDPEKLRGVFEALLANPASRSLMRQLLKGAGMPFNEEAFEEQVKDSNYFTLAIAPILRSMPQQKLRVLAELQDPEKLSALVSSVSSLAQDGSQLRAVTAELSNDVKQTVNTIREAEERAASGSSSSGSSSSGSSGSSR